MDTTRRSDRREANRKHEMVKRRSGGVGFGAMRGGDQRAMIRRSIEDDAEPGRQSKHAGERNMPGPHRPLGGYGHE